MRRTIFLTSLKTALLAVPLLAACGNNSTGSEVVVPPGGLTLPDCADGQLIAVDAQRNLSCTQALTAGLQTPDCALKPNSALNAYDGIIECMAKGSGSTNSDLRKAIDNVVSQTNNINNTINSLKGGGGSAKFCGTTTATTNGAIVGNGQTGVAGAAYLCQQVATCNKATAKMCTVYDMYHSVATGVITQGTNVTRGWVFMASWQNAIGTDPLAGQGDNCGGYTYPTSDRKWNGTQVA